VPVCYLSDMSIILCEIYRHSTREECVVWQCLCKFLVTLIIIVRSECVKKRGHKKTTMCCDNVTCSLDRSGKQGRQVVMRKRSPLCQSRVNTHHKNQLVPNGRQIIYVPYRLQIQGSLQTEDIEL